MIDFRRVGSALAAAGIVSGSLLLGSGAAFATTMPAGPAPGYANASTTGSCHGVFGDYFGGVASQSGTGFSSMAPMGNAVGQSNAVGSCPYNGIPAPTFPPK